MVSKAFFKSMKIIVFGLVFYLLTYVNVLQFLDNDDRMSSKRGNLSA